MIRDRRRRPPFRRRGGIGLAAAAWLVVLGVCVGATVVVFSAPVHSAPLDADQQAFEYWAHHGSSVCAALDHEPTVDGLAIAAMDIFTHSGLTTRQTGQVIAMAIHFTCPRHQNLIDEYNATQNRQPRRPVIA